MVGFRNCLTQVFTERMRTLPGVRFLEDTFESRFQGLSHPWPHHHHLPRNGGGLAFVLFPKFQLDEERGEPIATEVLVWQAGEAWQKEKAEVQN